MAIVFTKAIPEDKLLFAYNNNIIRFNSDTGLIPATAQIIGLGFDIVLYPHPNGSFYFNFAEYIATLLNSDNFKDDMVVPALYWSYNWTAKIYLANAITIKINFTDTTNESVVRNLKWLSALTQLDEKEVLPANQSFLLTPKDGGEKPYLKFWKGYPFDVTFYHHNPTNMNIVNENDLEAGVGLQNYLISRVLITNGLNQIPIVINEGVSNLRFQLAPGYFYFALEKVIPTCGKKKYLKWINRYGGWNYWLFDDGKKTLTPKSLGELNNDFNNVEDTLSQTYNIGVSSKKTLFINDDVTEREMITLSDLFESPKVYLFIGVPNEANSFDDWLEVNVKDKVTKIEDGKYNFINTELEIELPARITRTL